MLTVMFVWLRKVLMEKRKGSKSIWRESWTAMKAVTKVKTFQVIVLQGLVGSLPWTAMVFFTMWFELIGEHVCITLSTPPLIHSNKKMRIPCPNYRQQFSAVTI